VIWGIVWSFGKSINQALRILELIIRQMEESFAPGETNLQGLSCPLCNCKILKPGLATLVEKEILLPKEKKQTENDQNEVINLFWKITNMMHFENIGFTNTVELKHKYLTCADCERPCFGIQILTETEKDNFYIACSRVSSK